MRLLLKWLRPEVVPSPRRKKIPFGMRVQLFLYRRCIKRLLNWYPKYAFSDTIFLTCNPSVRIVHEHRDYSFEAELKRMRIPVSDGMIERHGASSSFADKRKSQRYYSCFHFEDHFLVESDGKKVSIDHGNGRSFVSTIRGKLKESDNLCFLAKYAFTGSSRSKPEGLSIRPSLSNSTHTLASGQRVGEAQESFQKTTSHPRSKTRGLFEDDPLLGNKVEISNISANSPSPAIKSVEGVTIDESF